MALRDKVWFPILYMFAITFFFSATIIFFGNLTRRRVQDNQLIAFERAVLEALPVDMPEPGSPSGIHNTFATIVRDPDASSAGALRLIEDDSVIAYALPLEGPGFWAPIKGVIGIAADKRTITGIAFYEQNETPGLGGEIAKREFTSQFIGKRLSNTDPAINILPVAARLDENSVHAVTGATQTSSRLSRFMNELIKDWRDQVEGVKK
jgi:Na+-transporting NADH:ubiquinone oxidoreductase subunit C